MLVSVSCCRQVIHRRSVLLLIALGCVVSALPTLVGVPLQADQEKSSEVDQKKTGRIFVTLSLGEDGKPTERLIIAIDPETGDWQKMSDAGDMVRVSPDRQTLAFMREGAIWNCDAQGGNNAGKISSVGSLPVWSPDGQYLVSTSLDKEESAEGKDFWKTVRFRADGTGSVEELRIPSENLVWDWSADGKWLATISTKRPDDARVNSRQIVVMHSDGKEQRQVTRGNDNLYPRFSPDGKRVCYLAVENKTRSIRVAEITTGEETILLQAGEIAPKAACWSPDGKQVAVLVFEFKRDSKGNTVLDPKGYDHFRLMVIDVDGKKRRDVNLKLGEKKIVFIGHPDWR